MKTRHRIAGIAALATIAFTLGAAPSYARGRTVDKHSTPLTQKMDPNDQVIDGSKSVVAFSAPSAGQTVLDVKETIHYLHVPFNLNPFASPHNTDYFMVHTEHAQAVQCLTGWVLRDSDGAWYKFGTGSTAAIPLQGKPSCDLGARASVIAGNDSRVLLGSPKDGGVDSSSGLHTFAVSWAYTHREDLYDSHYTLGETLGSKGDSSFGGLGFAFIGGTEYSINQAGQVNSYSSKPIVDLGAQAGKLDPSDRTTDTYPSVTAGQITSGGNRRIMVAEWTYLHNQEFHLDRYTLDRQFGAELVPEASAYFAFIDGTEYRVRLGDSQVYRLQEKPVIGVTPPSSTWGDQLHSVDVIDVAGAYPTIFVTTRYHYWHEGTYVIDAYHLDDRSVAVYDTNYSYWYVNVNGVPYPLAFSGDNSFGWNSSHIIQVPSQFARPTYVVPSNNGGPPAVIPGRGPSSGPELNIPDSRPSTAAPDPIPGCIPGMPCGGAPQSPAPAPKSGCIPGIPC
jgi:hypothetical protein